jgi:Holliday junction resolvase RusA-like endonuclease
VGYSITFEIRGGASDSNRILGVNRFVKHKIFSEIKEEVRLATLGKTPESPLINFKISVVRHGKKYLDFDNLVASLKPTIDGCKIAGIIEDDNWSLIKKIDVDQVISKNPKLVIEIRESEEPLSGS